MLSDQQADEQKQKHLGERLSKSHHPDKTAEAGEPLSHTSPPTVWKTPFVILEGYGIPRTFAETRDIWAALGGPAGAGVDADSIQRCFPTPVIPQFCDKTGLFAPSAGICGAMCWFP